MDPMMKTMIAAALLLASSTTWAQAQEKTITCDGPYRGERIGYCHLMDHQLNVLDKEVPEPEGLDKIDRAGCEMYERCIIRARVIDRGKVDGYQNWTVLRVYSARRR
jgi:hypothetical protein